METHRDPNAPHVSRTASVLSCPLKRWSTARSTKYSYVKGDMDLLTPIAADKMLQRTHVVGTASCGTVD